MTSESGISFCRRDFFKLPSRFTKTFPPGMRPGIRQVEKEE